MTRPNIMLRVVACALAAGALVSARSLQHPQLHTALDQATRGFDGRVGVCVQDATGATCINGSQRFPLQSIMKLLVGLAVMDAADHHRLHLPDGVTVRTEDLSVGVQPLAKLITQDGFRTTLDDLVRRSIVDSDSAAADFLIARLGGATGVQAVLDRNGLSGVRFDRDERHLQTETLGLEWRPEFLDPAAFERAVTAVSDDARDAAFRAYQQDLRDTATPAGMAALLTSLGEGELLSTPSTKRLLDIMSQTVTFPDRLKAGLAPGWELAHKTGTSGTWRGVTAATNDVGILKAPDGRLISIVVFIADSRAAAADRAALMASITRMTIQHDR